METVLTLAAAGSNGSAAVTKSFEIAPKGWLEAIQYSYTNAPGTTTITIAEVDGGQRTLLAVPAGNTNGIAYVRAAAVNTANAAITNSFARIYLNGHEISVAVASANPNTVIVVRFIYAESYWE